MQAIIYWLDLGEGEIGEADARTCLSVAEWDKLALLRFEKRRREWLLGRLALKRLLAALPAYRRFSMKELEVLNNPAGAPYVQSSRGAFLTDQVSLSHSNGTAFCAAAADAPGVRIGVDLEKVESRSDVFVEDYFTASERALVASFPARGRMEMVNLAWSMKEAMLKALGAGLHRDTRRVEVRAAGKAEGAQWREAQLGDDERHDWRAWFQFRDGFVLTIAACGAPGWDAAGVRLERLEAVRG